MKIPFKFLSFLLLTTLFAAVALEHIVAEEEAEAVATGGFDEIIGWVKERLALADQVVKYKVAIDKPIDDPEREDAIMKKTMEEVKDEPERFQQFVKVFFVDQMEANKVVQRALRDERNELAEQEAVTDLGPVRGKINELNGKLLAQLRLLYNQNDEPAAIVGGGVNPEEGLGCSPIVEKAFWEVLEEQVKRRKQVVPVAASSVTLARINAFYRAVSNLCSINKSVKSVPMPATNKQQRDSTSSVLGGKITKKMGAISKRIRECFPVSKC